MHEAVSRWAQSVQIETCRVVNPPDTILLCGGVIGSATDPFRSARDYFQRYLRENHPDIFKRVKLAETISGWIKNTTFSDLLELEEYFADLSDLIVLFVESPGSIAELGAFAVSNALRPKTLVVLNSSHPLERTFIADGPVKRLQDNDHELVRYYYWDSENLEAVDTGKTFEELSSELSQLLIDREKSTAKESIISRSHGHLMLLAADVVNIIGIVTREDISGCLGIWHRGCPPKELAKYLLLLRHLDIVRDFHYSTGRYLVSGTQKPFIRYDFLPGTAVCDRERIKRDARSVIEEISGNRARALKSYIRKLSRNVENV